MKGLDLLIEKLILRLIALDLLKHQIKQKITFTLIQILIIPTTGH